MDWWKSGLSALGLGGLFASSSAMGMLSSVQQYNYQKKLNQQQYNLTQRGYRESALNQKIGYMNAGLNPALMYSNGVSFGNYNAGQASAVDMSGILNNSLNSLTNAKQQRVQAEEAEAGIGYTNAQTEYIKEQIRTERLNQQMNLLQQQGQQIDNALKNKDLSTYDKRFLIFQKREIAETQATLTNSVSNQMQAESALRNASTNAMTYAMYRGMNKPIIEFNELNPALARRLYGFSQFTGGVGNIYRHNSGFSFGGKSAKEKYLDSYYKGKNSKQYYGY